MFRTTALLLLAATTACSADAGLERLDACAQVFSTDPDDYRWSIGASDVVVDDPAGAMPAGQYLSLDLYSAREPGRKQSTGGTPSSLVATADGSRRLLGGFARSLATDLRYADLAQPFEVDVAYDADPGLLESWAIADRCTVDLGAIDVVTLRNQSRAGQGGLAVLTPGPALRCAADRVRSLSLWFGAELLPDLHKDGQLHLTTIDDPAHPCVSTSASSYDWSLFIERASLPARQVSYAMISAHAGASEDGADPDAACEAAAASGLAVDACSSTGWAKAGDGPFWFGSTLFQPGADRVAALAVADLQHGLHLVVEDAHAGRGNLLGDCFLDLDDAQLIAAGNRYLTTPDGYLTRTRLIDSVIRVAPGDGLRCKPGSVLEWIDLALRATPRGVAATELVP